MLGLVIIIILLLLVLYSINMICERPYNTGLALGHKKSYAPYNQRPVIIYRSPMSDPAEENYADYMINAGLDKSVVESHNNFVSEIGGRTSGASTMTENSGDVDINRRVGLRRTNYAGAFSQADARVVSSELPDQMYAPTKFCF